MHWGTRKVLYSRLSNTMDDELSIEMHQKTLIRYSAPKIFNTDPGSQFTTPRFTNVPEQKRELPQARRTPDETDHNTSAATLANGLHNNILI